MIYLGYILTILSILLYSLGLQLEKKAHIILSQIGCKLLTSLSLYCFSSWSGVWLHLISLGVLFISYLKEKTNAKYSLFYVMFQLIYINILILTFNGLSSILVFVSSSLSLFSLFWLKEQPFRIIGFIKSIIYLIYQLSIGNWAGLTEIIILYSYYSSYVKYNRQYKKYKENFYMSNNKIRLKSCPFCGENTVKIIPFENNKFILSHWYTNVSKCPIATADEDTGIGSTYFETEEEAAETWNRRFD